MSKPNPAFRKIPKGFKIRNNDEARVPQFDSTLGIAVPAASQPAKHRVVTLGDSLTHGFKSGAIFETDLAWPMIVAYELGWDDSFRRPHYNGFGGLPFNIEYYLHELEHRYGDKIDWFEVIPAVFSLRNIMAHSEDWWERGPGSQKIISAEINHNLAVYGWDVRDTFDKRADWLRDRIKLNPASDNVVNQLIENANEIAALRVLGNTSGSKLSPVDAALELGKDGGIETLIVCVGANNALGAVTSLYPQWTQADGNYKLIGSAADKTAPSKDAFNVWHPKHFKAEYALLVAELKKVKAQHVLLGTVPHVTIAPVARGFGRKVRPGSRYFPHYTRPWIGDDQFDPKDDPCIDEDEARAIDSAIDEYNDFITDQVRQARQGGLDWHLVEMSGMLDRLASRRFIDDPTARPDWWSPWELAPELQSLKPIPPNSHFFASGPNGRIDGGLFALDGIHPTTIGYGVFAQEIIRVMQVAGVKFYLGNNATERSGTVRVDFQRLIKYDTLISSPPRSLSSDLKLLGWIDQNIGGLFRHIFKHGG